MTTNDSDLTPDPTPDPTPGPTPDPAPSEADTQQQPATPYLPPAPTKVRWRDRLFAFRAVVAVALASVILGLGAGIVGSLAFDHDQDRAGRQDRFERQGGPGERGGFPGGPGNAPQQGTNPMPPGSLPQQEESDAAPQDDTTSSS